jgi:AcrR family transcriptional regulator
MREVAARAELSIATIYNYFPSKTHLFVSALEWELDRFDDYVCRGLGSAINPFDRLRMTVGRLLDDIEAYEFITETLTHAYLAAHAVAPGDAQAIRTQTSNMFVHAMSGVQHHEIYRPTADLVTDVLTSEVLRLTQGRRSYLEIRTRLAAVIELIAAKH